MQVRDENRSHSPTRRTRRFVGHAIREIKHVFGIESFLPDEDRRVLEQTIFPYFLNDSSYRTILFVGCDWFTRGYNKRFQRDKRYVTIDIDSTKRKFGAKEHIVDNVKNLARHFETSSLDLIFINGVLGWGLDARSEVEQSFRACFEALRQNGILVIGWDDIAPRRPLSLDDCESLRRFKPFLFPPLQTTAHLTDTQLRHTFNFYEKP